MEHALKNLSYTYKRTSSTNDNVTQNSSHVRVFRDESTSIFTNVVFDTDQLLSLFLDYTFHRLYSEVITNINDKLINSIPFTNSNNQIVHIQPLVGLERIYLIFKGGTLMKKYFDKYIDDLFITENKEVFSDDDISKKYGNIFTKLNYNFDKEQNIPIDPNDMNLNTANKVFKNKILKENFKISDTDYSLYINATLHERYNVIHKFAIQLLGKAFDKMTDECDQYFEDVTVRNRTNFRDANLDIIINKNPIVDNQPYNTFSGILLNELRNFLNSNINITNIQNGNFDDLPIQNIRIFLQNWSVQSDIYESYNQAQITSLLKYIQKINNIFTNSIGPINLRGMGVMSINENVYNILFNNIKVNIDLLVEKKFYLLKINNFYTIEKIRELKTQLTNWYKNILQDDDKLNDKFERSYDPRYVTEKKDKYKLHHDKIHISANNQDELTDNNFIFSKRNSTIVLSKNNPIYFNNIITINIPKNHYITFNETIRKIRANGKTIIDFDLMRSKFNIIINKINVLTKNDQPYEAYIPSEFIDVSIPRFEDISRNEFFNNLINHNNNIPTSLTFRKYPGILISSYSNSEILEDLLYILFNQNMYEPYLDIKYKKRIIRGIVLIIIQFLIKIRENPQLDRNNEIRMIRMVFELCYAVKEHVEGRIEYPYHIVAKFLEGYNHNNMNDPKNIELINYLKIVNNLKNEWIKEQNNKLTFFIHNEFKLLENLILNIIRWSFMYTLNDNDIIKSLNSISKYYLQVQLYNINNTNPNGNYNDFSNVYFAKINFIKMLTIIYDYGFKLLFVIDNNKPNPINISPDVIDNNKPNPINISRNVNFIKVGGSNNNYYDKYIKYKTKYLKK
jgi:hypothetical protein